MTLMIQKKIVTSGTLFSIVASVSRLVSIIPVILSFRA